MNATPATECFDMTNTPDTFTDDLDENTSMVVSRLRSGPVDSDLCFDAANTIAVLRAERDTLKTKLEAQTYTYIGKDGVPVLARTLEDERDTLKARVAELEAAQVAAVKPLEWNHDPTGYFREYITTHGPAHYYITLETYDTYMLVRHDGRNMGRGGVEDLKALAQELHEKELRAMKGGA